MCAGKRGLTLVELMLGGVLLLLILSIVAQVVVPMGRGTRRGALQIELQQLAQTAMSSLASDLASTPREGLVLIAPATPSDRTILALHRLGDVTALGGQQWETRLVVYWLDPGTRRLTRETYPPKTPNLGRDVLDDAPFKPTPAELQSLVTTASGEERVMAAHVQTWTVDVASDPMSIQLVLQAPSAGGPPERFELVRRLFLRNERF